MQPIDLHHLRLDSTLADLPHHDFTVAPDVLGQAVAEELERRPTIPGVIVQKGEEVLGVFSRRQFLERVGRPYGVEVYLNRPIAIMVKNLAPTHLAFLSTQTIQSAAEATLHRSEGLLDDPVVVLFPDGRLRLLHSYVLILAQSHLLSLLTNLEKNRRQLAESLERIGRELATSRSLDKLTKRILKELDKVMPHERALVMLQEGEDLYAIAMRGFPEHITLDDIRIRIRPTADDVFRRIVNTQEAIAIADVTQDPEWQLTDKLPLNRSWLGVPLTIQGRVIGMISVTRTAANAFTPDDVMLTRAFASQAAVAIENARLNDEIHGFNTQLEQMVAERTAELNRAYGILERLDKTKSDFINVSAHELRTPITVIRGYAQMLATNPHLHSDDTAPMLLEGIQTGIQRLHQVVNNMLDVAKIDANTLQVVQEEVFLRPLIEKIAATYEHDLLQRRIGLDLSELPHLPPLTADPDLLAKLFDGLLVNAIKYTPDGGHIRIHGRVLPATDMAEIALADTGIGIAPENHTLIFEKFFQTGKLALHSSGRTKFKGGGAGLGLAIAKGIVEAHHGRIWVESAGYDEDTLPGSTFFIQLPYATTDRDRV